MAGVKVLGVLGSQECPAFIPKNEGIPFDRPRGVDKNHELFCACYTVLAKAQLLQRSFERNDGRPPGSVPVELEF